MGVFYSTLDVFITVSSFDVYQVRTGMGLQMIPLSFFCDSLAVRAFNCRLFLIFRLEIGSKPIMSIS